MECKTWIESVKIIMMMVMMMTMTIMTMTVTAMMMTMMEVQRGFSAEYQ